MMDGFDLDTDLVCEGIIGDGCGGGRLFFVKDNTLKVYDPTTKEAMLLLENVYNAQSISKSACIITIVCSDENVAFDLSKMHTIDL